MAEQVVLDALRALLDVFDQTHPGRDNIQEWNEIRSVSDSLRPSLSAGDADSVTNGILQELGHITPGSSNVFEWAAIRNVCATQLASGAPTKTKLLGLLFQLSKTNPQHDNILEWERIRAVCDAQIQRLTSS
jgi:hypothetical protein